ncbi:hypothetical protein P153DRAFT_373757 [Dothidotthia symphoricarpi CBS 119687]|uniref:Uncharacterized protein n=1 Tax=Dothidotthia symphoricarpi CBS 119687 TaxID=1392245 RepID=A0A6A6AL27_9PLEO|nr:uncharacterized protein P153DRAFT_373757 [Dothidotthia symphoricarpi CBS 119687]KAF2131903.1 hypothetical protein P153DRAFT_373757 [Dothidotthia symphoricarpi CBS 119687]
MFSVEDVKDILQLLPPPQSNTGSLPSLVPSASGLGLVTLQQLQFQFQSRMTKETQRIPLLSLTLDLDVDQDVVLQLVRTQRTIALLSGDSRIIITESERQSIHEELYSLITHGLVSKSDFAKKKDIDTESLSFLLSESEEIVDIGEYVCSASYEHKISETLEDGLRRSLKETQSVDFAPTDFISKDTPGSSSMSLQPPSMFFVLRILDRVLRAPDLAENFYLHEREDSIRCTPKRLLEQEGEAVVRDLQTGNLVFLEISQFRNRFIYTTPRHIAQYFETSPDVEVIDSYAISKVWASSLGDECRQTLDRDGVVNVRQRLTVLPPDVGDRVRQQVEQFVFNLVQKPDTELHRVGEYWFTEDGYINHKDRILSIAAADANFQWQQLTDSPEKEVKFSLSNITTAITDNEPVLRALVQERSVEKAAEECFWNTVSNRESENEAEFSISWNERVVLRTYVYNQGLDAVGDQKLRDQLAELFAAYAQKELIPDAITKARSNGLMMSRKTRKNVQKLESRLSTEKMDTSTIVIAVNKFNKKQSIEAPGASSLEESKKTMVLDMTRRMQKQKKSDGPVLFLTLVVLLFAKHHPGVVYATGKFAPKLLKQLKSVLEPVQYEQLEKWKEAAKTGTLSAEDRDEMKKIAEV